MAALRGSAFRSLEKVSGRPQSDVLKKKTAASFSTLKLVPHRCSLTWTSLLRSHEGNVSAKPYAVGGKASSVETAMESDIGVSYEKLQELLAAGEWELADEETRRLIVVLAGENAVKRKYVFFSEVSFMPKADLCTIDRLWRTHSHGKFGYSVQRKIMKMVNGDSTLFFKKVGWMKPLRADSLQYNYCSFPSEFEWGIAPSTPDGHLPLTNALRGTQLLKCLLDHPAFEFADDELRVSSSSPSAFVPDATNKLQSSQQHQQQHQKKPISINYSF